MADNKKSFIAYCDWGEIFDELEDDEAGRLVKHLFKYVRDENPTAEDKLTKMMFIQIKQSLKRDLVKYDKYVDKQKVNGAKGGRPKKNPNLNTETQKTQPFIEKPKKADSVNVTVNDNDNDNDSVNDNVIVNDINKTNKSKTQKRVFSEEVKNCLRNCLEYFDKSEHPDNFEKWLDTVEKLNTIEKIPFELIEHIVKLTKNDEFWSANFQSITKLRKKNKDGIKYIKYFYNKFKIQNEKSKSNTDNHLQRLRAENPGLYKML